MTPTYLPSTPAIRDIFTDELTQLGGTVSDVFDDGSRLFMRSILPSGVEVRRRDTVLAGVALRAVADEVLVHPYTFRQVCSNGAIHTQVIDTCLVRRSEAGACAPLAADVISELRHVIRACAGDEAFATVAARMRSAADIEADLLIQTLPLLTRLPKRVAAELLRHIGVRFERGRDRSLFGVMNAVTSVARDTRDPDIRWRLEELGGGLLARRASRAKTGPGSASFATVA